MSDIRTPVSSTERIQAQHELSYAIERAQRLRRALDPAHGVTVVRRRDLATDLERIAGPLITLQALNRAEEKERARMALYRAMYRAFAAGHVPLTFTELMKQAARQFSAPPDQPLAVTRPPQPEAGPSQPGGAPRPCHYCNMLVAQDLNGSGIHATHPAVSKPWVCPANYEGPHFLAVAGPSASERPGDPCTVQNLTGKAMGHAPITTEGDPVD